MTITTTGPMYATGEDHFSNIDPEEYSVVGYFYQGDSEAMHEAYGWGFGSELECLFEELERRFGIGSIEEMVAEAKPKDQFHCMGCGTNYLHGAAVIHEPTVRLLMVGQVCASKHYGLPNIVAKMQKKAKEIEERNARRAAGLKQLSEHPELQTAFFLNQLAEQAEAESQALPGELRTSFQADVLGDMFGKLLKWGSLSEKQIAFAKKLGGEIAERVAKAQEPVEDEGPQEPVPEFAQGATVEGKVVSAKYQDSYYGIQFKMLVETVQGYRLWGSVPKALDDATSGWAAEGMKGIEVRFVADIERSQKDAFFGFFKRPRQVEIIDLHEDDPID